ncbi:MAG TPA: serine/threonine-protein kinase [Kofleriaceae bacterium]|nr:serine/threonine-protein kinase [Kofleriaceae bacterium]
MMKGLANVGDVLAGKYRVDKILGLGGMGMVVAATHLELEQTVALKFMLPAALESPEASARFMREARAAGKLTSEHICRVTDVGRFDSGAPYIVMEYLEGYDLGTMLKRRGPLRVSSAVDYILQACEGMAEAHAQGIVHRDLKPDNLYLASRADGGHIIKVLDFGISKASVTGIATQTGDVLGSPAYMAPEQMRATKDVDARADVWSIGIVLYQLLTGRLPFGGDSLPTLCMSVLNDEPVPPEEIRHDLPAGLSHVILRCLAKNRDDRYSDVGDLAAALGPFATPNGFGSVTRVRSALKGRQAPPDPSQTVPHGFERQDRAGTMPFSPVAPTLHGEDGVLGPGSDLFMPRMPAETVVPMPAAAPVSAAEERAVGVTTVGGSSGESIEMKAAARTQSSRTRSFPIGLVGGLCGAIGLVLVLIVMVLRSGGSGGSGGGGGGAEPAAAQQQQEQQQQATTTPAPAPDEAPKPPPTPAPPTVTPIEASAGGSAAQPAGDPAAQPAGDPAAGSAGSAGSAEPIAADPGAADPGAVDPKTTPGAKPGGTQRPKNPRVGRPPKGGAKQPVGKGSGSTPPPDENDDDQWGRMQHDQPKDKTP